jgi:hypothetical protein
MWQHANRPDDHPGMFAQGATMECEKEANLARCNCSWPSCSRKGICCDCIAYHLKSRELPACVFPPEAERTYDRSFAHFAQLVEKGKV